MGAVVNIENGESHKKRFSDFADEPVALEGKKIKIDDILNSEIEIMGYRLTDSKFPKGKSTQCLMIQFRQNGELKIVFTGSNVLAKQCEQYKKEFPFFTEIKKIGRYFTLS